MNWGRQDERESVAAIHAALDAGANWVDTAPFYGLGPAEEVVRRALPGRDDTLVFTKCGTLLGGDGDDFKDLRPEAIRRDVEGSLRRLGVEQVDLLQVHDRDPRVRSRRAGGRGGLSDHRPEEIERALAVGPVAALQLQYSALERGAEDELLPLAARPVLDDGDFRRPHAFAALDLTALRGELRVAGNGSVTEGALRFVLRHPAVTAAIVGVRNEREGRALARLGSPA